MDTNILALGEPGREGVTQETQTDQKENAGTPFDVDQPELAVGAAETANVVPDNVSGAAAEPGAVLGARYAPDDRPKHLSLVVETERVEKVIVVGNDFQTSPDRILINYSQLYSSQTAVKSFEFVTITEDTNTVTLQESDGDEGATSDTAVMMEDLYQHYHALSGSISDAGADGHVFFTAEDGGSSGKINSAQGVVTRIQSPTKVLRRQSPEGDSQTKGLVVSGLQLGECDGTRTVHVQSAGDHLTGTYLYDSQLARGQPHVELGASGELTYSKTTSGVISEETAVRTNTFGAAHQSSTSESVVARYSTTSGSYSSGISAPCPPTELVEFNEFPTSSTEYFNMDSVSNENGLRDEPQEYEDVTTPTSEPEPSDRPVTEEKDKGTEKHGQGVTVHTAEDRKTHTFTFGGTSLVTEGESYKLRLQKIYGVNI